MITSEKYYEPLSEKAFEEVKEKAIELWSTYDDEFGYATEKIERVKSIDNVRDNYSVILAMFDPSNQYRHWITLSNETRDEIWVRIPGYMSFN